MKKTQINRVRAKLHRDGYITRNECLDLPTDKITRLGAIIYLLRDELDIETEETDKDTIYRLKNRPPKVVFEIIEKDGVRVGVKKIIPYLNG